METYYVLRTTIMEVVIPGFSPCDNCTSLDSRANRSANFYNLSENIIRENAEILFFLILFICRQRDQLVLKTFSDTK